MSTTTRQFDAAFEPFEPEPLGPEHEAAVRRSFADAAFLTGLGARLERVGRGAAAIGIDASPALCGAPGGVHTGVVVAIAESAGALAVLASLDAGARCRVVEHKIDYAGAMTGVRIVATARVLRPGGSLSVARVEVHADSEGRRQKLAVLLATYLHDARG